jgi:hypothetical protein
VESIDIIKKRKPSMNNETLKYYIALQPKFREVMGEWQSGDAYYNQLDRDFGCVEDAVCDDFNANKFYVFRLPLPIDPRNPERGLWGMLDKQYAYILAVFTQAKLSIFDGSKVLRAFETNTTELALLKALAHQEGVEVK